MAILKFGCYPQNNGSVREPIDWLVLKVKGNEALLVSRFALECKQYHHESADITWENCDLRKWLNDDFLKEAFTPEQQEIILPTAVFNNDEGWYGTRGGNDTRDLVFCLSFAEAARYFNNDRERMCRATALAKAHGAYVSNACCYWWQRSPGHSQNRASVVDSDGALYPCGGRVSSDHFAVRPALRIIWNQ